MLCVGNEVRCDEMRCDAMRRGSVVASAFPSVRPSGRRNAAGRRRRRRHRIIACCIRPRCINTRAREMRKVTYKGVVNPIIVMIKIIRVV